MNGVFRICLRLSIRQRHALLLLSVAGILLYLRFRMMRSHSEPGWMVKETALKADSRQFTLGGEPFRILGGSIHYFRVPRAYWEDRLLKLKACGLNTLTTYVPWNLHEPEQGMFNFEDQLDLQAYLSLANMLELKVILRPGPYICSEWDLGGLPSWLLRDPNMKLRSTYPGFKNAVEAFFDELMLRVSPFQFSKGGPIIAVQVENEYGSFFQDENYMPFIREALLSRGITELLMTSDNKAGLERGRVAGALETINFKNMTSLHIKNLEEMQPHKPKMVMEFWPGWFDTWGRPHQVYPAQDVLKEVIKVLESDMSINLYMFHGGTNFGFMNGAVGSRGDYKPIVTSYDYDAPLSEAGDYTTKYNLLREMFLLYNSRPLLDKPYPLKKSEYQPVIIQKHLSLWHSLTHTDKPMLSETPVNMENLLVNNNNGQSYGYTLYETSIATGGTLDAKRNVRDRALVFVDRLFVGVLDYNIQEITLPPAEEKRTLSLLVENCGRVNYAANLEEQRKGLIGDIELNKEVLRHFVIFSLDMKPDFMQSIMSSDNWVPFAPQSPFLGFLYAELHVNDDPLDTFIKLPGWHKGVVFVNGRNLGRYWSIGPQQTLYLPGPWLQRGQNQIIVFEEQRTTETIEFTTSPDLGKPDDVL